MAQISMAQRPRLAKPQALANRALLYLLVFILCVLFGFPLFWTLMSSLKTGPEMADFPPPWVPAWFSGGRFELFLMREFFLSLPKDLHEAALIDGAGYFRIFWSILLPLCKPILATLAIITIIGTWSDFLGPLIYLNSPEK